METTPAILLRKTRLTETSLIVTWMTSAHGRLKTVAKGARQPKSRFSGCLDLFYESEIQFARSRKSELHILREVALIDPHEGLRLDARRVALAAYCVELLELVTETEHSSPDLYDLLHRVLRHLNANEPSRRAMLHYENELTRLLGIRNPAVAASVALARTYHQLPVGRASLWKSLT